MKDKYVPILVQKRNKKELWRFDLDDYTIAELSEIKEKLLKYNPYSDSIIALDKLIREKAEEIMPYNKAYGKSYVKVYKENKKQEKLRKRTKIRRR